VGDPLDAVVDTRQASKLGEPIETAQLREIVEQNLQVLDVVELLEARDLLNVFLRQ
jgi:hypothetical protein